MIWNIGSIVFGFIAWGLAFGAIKSKKKQNVHVLSGFSFSLCVISLCFQFLEIGDRVNIRDFAAIEDTIGAVIFAAVTLSVVTITLNVVAIVKNRIMKG